MPLPNSKNTEAENSSTNGSHVATYSLTDLTTMREPSAEHQVASFEISPFPLASLPGPIRQFVEEGAPAFPVPPELLALPSLVAAGVAIGNSRVVELKPGGWKERPALYAAVVCESGSMKSPAMAQATECLKKHQTLSTRTWTSDATVESIARILHQAPRGILLYKDELSAWVRAMNQYRSGKGADKEFYLSMWGGQSFVVDRVGLEGGPICIRNPFLSVVGAIPPDMLAELDPSAGQADGFLPRLLFAWPQRIPTKWSHARVSPTTTQAYEKLFADLLDLEYDPDQGPSCLPLTSEAQARFIEWHDKHIPEVNEPAASPYLDGCYSKLKGYCARLALIHAVASDPATQDVGVGSVEAAISLVDYFKAQAVRIDGFFSCGKHDPVEKCKVTIRRRLSVSRSMYKRDLQRIAKWNAEHFNTALEQMTKAEVVIEGSTVTWNW